MLELLLEIRTENVPARLLEAGTRAIKDQLVEALRREGLTPRQAGVGFTPRRQMVVLRGLPTQSVGEGEQVAGPKTVAALDTEGNPRPPLRRFLERHGISQEELVRVGEGEEERFVYWRPRESRLAHEVLCDVVPAVLRRASWPEKIRWGAGDRSWVRPVRGFLALLDGEPLDVEVWGQRASRTTVGHPTLSPRTIVVRDAADYVRKLSSAGVEVRLDERRRRLAERVSQRARELGAEVVEAPELLEELALSCEFPGLVDGRIDVEFLALPREILVACLEGRQQAFCLESGGTLAPLFLAVMDRPDDREGRVKAGNELAVRAHLQNARFIFEQDCAVGLAERFRRLEKERWPHGPGTYGDKATRLESVSVALGRELGWLGDLDRLAETSRLLKADVTTRLVREFPTLEGAIGGLLAREEGYPESLCYALYDHPIRGHGDLPRGRIGRVVALIDRLDTLVGLFASGRGPVAGTDPHRCAEWGRGAVRVLLEGGLDLDLDMIVARVVLAYGDLLSRSKDELLAELRRLLQSCLRDLLRQEGYASEAIESVLRVGGGESVAQLGDRVGAVHQLLATGRLDRVARTARLLLDVLKESPEYGLDPALLIEEAEKDLYIVLQKVRETLEEPLSRDSQQQWVEQIENLAAAAERFLGEVLVRDENLELRRNRLALLQGVHRLFGRRVRLAELSAADNAMKVGAGS